jgi:hypothetical protein
LYCHQILYEACFGEMRMHNQKTELTISFMLNVQARLNSMCYFFSFSVDKWHFISLNKKESKL